MGTMILVQEHDGIVDVDLHIDLFTLDPDLIVVEFDQPLSY